MGWLDRKMDKMRSQGKIPFLMYMAAKLFFGLGIAFIIAGAFPGAGWMSWGLIFVVLGIIFAVPMIKAFMKKY